MTTLRQLVVPISLCGLIPACGGGSSTIDRNNRGPFEVTAMSTGLGPIYPYRIRQVDERGNPTATVIDITEPEHLHANVNANNGVLPLATWPTTAILPNGQPGYHFLMVRFSHEIRPQSVLSDLQSQQGNSGLTGAIQVLLYDPVTEQTNTVRGRGFVGGKTYLDDLATPAIDLKLVQAVAINNGTLQVNDSRVAGFPRGFDGDTELVDPHVFVFVPDADGVLTTTNPETFPTPGLIRVAVTASVQDQQGHATVTEVCVATTVGVDPSLPQVLGFSRPSGPYEVTPGNNDRNVDPRTTILVRFSKPMQPRDVGAFFSRTDKTPPFRGITLTCTLAATPFQVIYYADPASVGNLCDYIITPAYNFPGQAAVQVRVNNTVADLDGTNLGTILTTNFQTGDGPGLVNAPVAPHAVYIGIGGSTPGIGVVDLNGFGQGTGVLARSNFPRNPNVGAPGLTPNLAPGTTNIDAGGEGPLTLTTDSQGSFRLIAAPVIGQVGDIHIGQPLDKVFHNENINPYSSRTNQINPGSLLAMPGNSIMSNPHPNPPRLVFPPPNPARNIFAEEGTAQSCAGPAVNRLVRGNPFSPTNPGLFWTNFAGTFYGPAPAPPNPNPPTPYCPYTYRQQIGHFLYAIDRANRTVLVLNSNRFNVVETIRLSDPTAMTVSPNLRTLAVTNFSSGTVSFIDIDPFSANFHTVVTETRVGRGPNGIAWQPEGEDVLVVNKIDSSMTILNGSDFKVRKTLRGLILDPIDVCVTQRQLALGFQTGIYFAYILNGNGTVAVFESGPDGVNGIGFDDLVGIPSAASFLRARAMQVDPISTRSAVWVAHEDAGGLGQISHLELTSSQTGPIPITPVSGGFILPPTFRQREWTVNGRIGGASPTTPVHDRLSGNSPIDIAFDDMQNNGAFPDVQSSQITNLTYAQHSGKAHTKILPTGPAPAVTSRFIFIALADAGKLDIFELDTGTRVKTLDVPGVATVANYWRQ